MAEIFGVSDERIRQIEEKALAKLSKNPQLRSVYNTGELVRDIEDASARLAQFTLPLDEKARSNLDGTYSRTADTVISTIAAYNQFSHSFPKGLGQSLEQHIRGSAEIIEAVSRNPQALEYLRDKAFVEREDSEELSAERRVALGTMIDTIDALLATSQTE